jgi:hypothetical protein
VLFARADDAALPPVIVYKSSTCACCNAWVKHLRASGFRGTAHDVTELDAVKRRFGVPPRLAACHTATVGGYAIEGHVPAADIRRLLAQRPPARGLAVPGMPVGSPGMEAGKPEPYATVPFRDDGRERMFERH